MQFSISRKELLPALKHAAAASDPKGTIKVLANVLVRYSQGAIEIIGSDTETEVRTMIPVPQSFDDSDYGETTVPAAKFMEIVKDCGADAEIRFTLKDDRVEVKSGKSRFTLSTLSVDNFPAVYRIDPELSPPIQLSQAV